MYCFQMRTSGTMEGGMVTVGSQKRAGCSLTYVMLLQLQVYRLPRISIAKAYLNHLISAGNLSISKKKMLELTQRDSIQSQGLKRRYVKSNQHSRPSIPKKHCSDIVGETEEESIQQSESDEDEGGEDKNIESEDDSGEEESEKGDEADSSTEDNEEQNVSTENTAQQSRLSDTNISTNATGNHVEEAIEVAVMSETDEESNFNGENNRDVIVSVDVHAPLNRTDFTNENNQLANFFDDNERGEKFY